MPHDADWAASQPLWLAFLCYVLSFIYVGIYWNKYQHQNYPRMKMVYSFVGNACLRRHGRMLSGVVVGLSLCAALPHAAASTGREDGESAFRRGEYEQAAEAWSRGSRDGDSEQQELIADLLLGVHAHEVKHGKYDAIKYLYRAAIDGRQSAMVKLSEMLRSGTFGAKKLPDAAMCWSTFPKSVQGILACVDATAFQSSRARVRCAELILMGIPTSLRDADGTTLARLCIANKTPALLVPGLPPSARDMRRTSEYARYGIEWVITGDVYNNDFEKFRDAFNNTIVNAIDAERGRGYLKKLGEHIERRISTGRQ